MAGLRADAAARAAAWTGRLRVEVRTLHTACLRHAKDHTVSASCWSLAGTNPKEQSDWLTPETLHSQVDS